MKSLLCLLISVEIQKSQLFFKGPNATYHENYIQLTEGEGRYAEIYRIRPQHAVEDKRYIYVPFANAGAGTGVFYELQAIDKKTMKTKELFNVS